MYRKVYDNTGQWRKTKRLFTYIYLTNVILIK